MTRCWLGLNATSDLKVGGDGLARMAGFGDDSSSPGAQARARTQGLSRRFSLAYVRRRPARTDRVLYVCGGLLPQPQRPPVHRARCRTHNRRPLSWIVGGAASGQAEPLVHVTNGEGVRAQGDSIDSPRSEFQAQLRWFARPLLSFRILADGLGTGVQEERDPVEFRA